VAERVSDDEEETSRKTGPVHPQPRDGYCQCKDRAMPADMVDRRPLNLVRDFRAAQRSANASKMLPRPLRSASVDRTGDGWPGTSSVKYQPISGAAVVSRYNGTNAQRVSMPAEVAGVRGQMRTGRRHRTTPPPRDGVGREITTAHVMTPSGSTAPHAAVDSDLASDVSDLDQDIVDDLHLAETVPDFTRRACRANDTLRSTPSTEHRDSQPCRQNGRIATDSAPVILRRASAQDQIRHGDVGTSRTQRAGSYHGSVHHSITMPELDLPCNPRTWTANRSPVGSLKNALANFAGRWSKSGRRCSASKTDVSGTEDGGTGCGADHGAGLMYRIVARASCRLPKTRSKSGDRCVSDGVRSTVAVCGGRVSVSSVSLRHPRVKSSDLTTSTMNGDGADSELGRRQSVDTTNQHNVPYIDDSDTE